MSGSKRKKRPSADFKRIKAKVGKKAQRQNDTDVSFQSASLHLGQAIQGDADPQKSPNSILLSSRGKSLYELVATASSHPAAAARCSSLKGILDIVKSHPPGALLPNLSALIPTCVHSCVDEDQDTRSVAIEVLLALLSQLQEKAIKPFGILLVARVSSALHSLDAPTRMDGVKMVKLVSTACPILTASSIDQLMPPFVSLLADSRTRKYIDDILQSLTSLLRVSVAEAKFSDSVVSYHITPTGHPFGNKKENIDRDHYPDMIYFSGGRSRNAILKSGRPVHTLPRAIESVSQLSGLDQSTLSSRDGREVKYKTNLMAKLRDILIESVNLVDEPNLPSTNRMARSSTIELLGNINYSRIILLLRSVRLLHRSFSTGNVRCLDEDDDETDFAKFTQQIVSVLMDIFPFDHDLSENNSAAGNKPSSVDDINATIAITILDLSYEDGANSTRGVDNAKDPMKAIYSYVIPRMNRLQDETYMDSSSDLDITCKFLRHLCIDHGYSKDLISVSFTLQELFFSNYDAKLARSNAGRRISLAVMDLVDLTNYSLEDHSTSLISKSFVPFITAMPLYLEAWGADFVYESERILEGLATLVREVKEDYNNPMLESFRANWHNLVVDSNKSQSIFEMYPWHLQKKWLGLLVLLRNPTDQTLQYLASICARSKKLTLSKKIIEAVQGVRKSVPMQRFLTFLLKSAGITRHVKKVKQFHGNSNLDSSSMNIFDKTFFETDQSLDRTARALTELGSIQVLRMISSQLSSWQKEIKAEEGTLSLEFLSKARASYIILAYFFLVHSSRQKNQNLDDQHSIFDVMNGEITVDSLNDSICRFIRCIVNSEEAIAFHSKLTSPIIAILSSHYGVFSVVIRKISDWFENEELSKFEQNNVVLVLVGWMKNPLLKDALKRQSSTTARTLEDIDAISQNRALKDNELAQSLVPLLKAKCLD